jgi:phage terminase small subunit
MAAALRHKKSTLANTVKAFQSLSQVLSPTDQLSDVELTHFDRIIKSREAESWTPHDLSVATDLAKTMRRFGELQNQLDADGLTSLNQKGTLVAHPLLAASMGMSNTIQALSRTLGLSATQRGLAGAPQAGRNKADADARKLIEKVSAEDSLL